MSANPQMTPEQQEQFAAMLQEATVAFNGAIDFMLAKVRPSRARAIAMTHLETASLWATQACGISVAMDAEAMPTEANDEAPFVSDEPVKAKAPKPNKRRSRPGA